MLLRFLYAWRNFVRFAVTPTAFAFAVTDDNHGGETKATTTFDNGRTTLDFDDTIQQAVGQAFFLLVAFAAVTAFAAAAATGIVWCVTNGFVLKWR